MRQWYPTHIYCVNPINLYNLMEYDSRITKLCAFPNGPKGDILDNWEMHIIWLFYYHIPSNYKGYRVDTIDMGT